MKKMILLFCMLLIPVLLFGCGQTNQEQPAGQAVTPAEESPTLMIYSGAGLRKPVNELGKLFEQQEGIKVTFNYAGSAHLTSQILLTEKGDVILPGDVAELQPLRDKGMVAEEINLLYHVPVLVVPKGNPANIKSLSDLARPEVKVALGDSKANPIGKVADKALTKANLLEKVNQNVVTRTATVNELMVYLSMGQADAAIIWEENTHGMQDKVEVVPGVSELDDLVKVVPAGVLKCSAHPELAQKFAAFAASEEGKGIWEKWGFRTYEQQ